MKHLLSIVLGVALATTAFAQTRTLLNIDKNGIALQGYDPVAFFTDNAAVKGKSSFISQYAGAYYQFATREHKQQFDKEPAKYEPAFGGYCAYGVSRNKVVEIEVNAFQIVNGQLLLQYSKGVRDDFNKDTEANLAKARANWPVLVEKKGK
jgi:YHS domain-containing protein